MTVLTNTIPFWLLMLGGPALCALAGACSAWIVATRRANRELDAAWDQAYERGWWDSQVHTGTMVPDRVTPGPIAQRKANEYAAKMGMLEPYPPGVHHEGPRHAAPEPTTLAAQADAAVWKIKAEFAAIRQRFGLPAAV